MAENQNELLKPDHEKLAEGEIDPSSDFSDPEFSPGRKQLALEKEIGGCIQPLPVTPTQAKSDAVSKLLAKAVDRASELVLTPEESAALKAIFPDDCFRKGAAGKDNLLYLEHVHLRNRLDEVLGMGAAVLVPMNRWTEENGKATTVYLEAAFIVRGCYVTQAVGDMSYFTSNAMQNYGDAVEGAEMACLRRCCKKFGIGLQAWSKTWCEGWWARNRNGVASPAKPALNPLSADNIETLKLLMEDAGYFENKPAMKLFGNWCADACKRRGYGEIEKITDMPDVFFPEAVKALKEAIKKNEGKT